MRRAQELDPLSLIANAALGWIWNLQGRFDDAVAQCRRALELNPDFQLAWLWLGIAESGRGRLNEGRDALRNAVRLSGGSTLTLAALARVHAIAGQADSARAILTTIEARAADGYVPSYDIAAAYLALGDRHLALTRLEQALADRAHSMVFLHIDPQFVALRGDQRFRALVRGVEGK